MINNFIEDQYRPSHQVYTHPQTGHSIWLGDIQAALDTYSLHNNNIRTVVTAAAGMDHVLYDPPIHHVVYPLLDTKNQPISQFFNQFHQLAQQSLTKGSMLVHCAAGISRSSTLVLAYLMKQHGWPFKQAIAHLRTKRPAVCPNLGFQRQLKEYQRQLSQIPSSMEESRPSKETREELRPIKEPNLMRRGISKTSEEKKHYKVLPQIHNLGRTQLKPIILDLFSQEQDKQSSQRSRRSSIERRQDQIQFLGTRRVVFKPLKSRSVAEKSPLLGQLPVGEVGLEKLKNSLPIQQADQIFARKMHLREKNITERHLRGQPLHRLAFY